MNGSVAIIIKDMMAPAINPKIKTVFFMRFVLLVGKSFTNGRKSIWQR
jgi:hypothetical protein